MDTTPVMRRSRSKLSRRDRGLCSPSPMAVCAAAADRRPSSDATFSTPLRAPPQDSVCWDSPVSPFSPPLMSQMCEVYWEDETQRRAAEELKRAVNRPGDRVPPPLLASPAPLLPTGRRRTSRATRQQQQQLMALLEKAENLCCQGGTQAAEAAAAAAEEPEVAEVTESESEQPAAGGGRESDTSAVPEIESDPELDRSMLRCTQLAEQAASAAPAITIVTSEGRQSRSFNAFVMDAMPDDEDDIFSQIPEEALDGVDEELKSAAAAESSSGVSSGSSAPPPRPGRAGRGLPRTVSAPDYRPPGETCRRWTPQPGRPASQTITRPAAAVANSVRSAGQRNSSAVMKPSVLSNNNSAVMMPSAAVPNNSAVMKPAAVPTAAGPVSRPQTNNLRGTAPGATGVAASILRLPNGGRPSVAGAGAAAAAPADAARQKAEMNRRRAEALRRLRQNQRSRSTAVSGQTR